MGGYQRRVHGQRQTGCTLRLLRLTRNMERSYQMRFCHRIVNDYLGVIAHMLSVPLYSCGNDSFCLPFLIPLSLSKGSTRRFVRNPCLVNSTTAFQYGVCKRPRFAHHIILRFACTVDGSEQKTIAVLEILLECQHMT